MKSWALFSLCLIAGLGAFVCGLLVPAHLRAVNASVIARAGTNSPTVVERGLALVKEKKMGAAQLLSQAAQLEKIPGREKLESAISDLAGQNPSLQFWGSEEIGMLAALRKPDSVAQRTYPNSEPLTALVIRAENRDKVLDRLRTSRNPVVQEFLRFRAATNTVLFSPSQSASGQALDAAISICGLLLENGNLTVSLSKSLFAAAQEANREGNSRPFEEALLDFLSLGQRFNWGQLVALASRIESAETLHVLAGEARTADERLPVLFSAVEISDKPSDVAKYLATFPSSGLKDIGTSLGHGAAGLNELLRRQQRMHTSIFQNPLLLDYSLRMSWFALTVKWFLYLLGGFLLAAALHFAQPAVSVLERPLEVRGFHIAREILFALGFLLAVLLLSEPFLAQESRKVEMPFRLNVPMAGESVPAENAGVKSSFMNQTSMNLLIMLLFFVLQGLLYTACVVKLAEIRRQGVPARMKIKLLENEDHLFDAGLYLGFLGTIASFILYSLSLVHQFSLMVAYSSTSFGILFVSFFKIFHLRPVRRRLLLEADAGPGERETAARHPLAAPL